MLLLNPVAQTGKVGSLNVSLEHNSQGEPVTVLLKPGVMSPVAESVLGIAKELDVALDSVRTYRRYYLANGDLASDRRDLLFRKVLSNDAIEQVVVGPLSLEHLGQGSAYEFDKIVVPLRKMDDDALLRTSREGPTRSVTRRDADHPRALPLVGSRPDRRRTRDVRSNLVGALLAQ